MTIGTFVISKNNYRFLEKYWWPHMKPLVQGPVLNIDEGSDDNQKQIGKQLCESYRIEYQDRDRAGVQWNAVKAAKSFKEQGCKWMIWFQHDCWPLYNDFYPEFQKIIDSGKLDNFGTVGFNALATDMAKNHGPHMKLLKRGKKPLGILCRAPLEGYNFYSTYSYNPKKNKPIDMDKRWHNPFAIESVCWFAIAVNIDKFLNHIKPDENLRFHLAWDDVCFQFLNQNIYNVALPSLYIEHRPDYKPGLNLPLNSAKYTKSKNNYYFENVEHLNIWKDKWGFEWASRKSFEKVKHKYKGTLLWDFYHHNPQKGPLKVFDL